MTTIDALALVLVLAVVATLFSGAGWLTTRATLRERDTRYVTIARLEAALAAQQQEHLHKCTFEGSFAKSRKNILLHFFG